MDDKEKATAKFQEIAEASVQPRRAQSIRIRRRPARKKRRNLKEVHVASGRKHVRIVSLSSQCCLVLADYHGLVIS